MLGDIKQWLNDHKYKFTVFPALSSDFGKSVTVGVSLANLTAWQCKDFFAQLDKWTSNGVKEFELIEVDGVVFATFTAPLDTVYTLTLTVNGVKHFEGETSNRNEAGGAMLDRFIAIRDDERSLIHIATLDRNKAHISCQNRDTGDKFSFDWKITERITPFCG